MRPVILALPLALFAAPVAAQADADMRADTAIVLPDFDAAAPDSETPLESLSQRLSDPRTQSEMAATVAVLSEILLDMPLAPLIEPLAKATADAADVPRRPVDPDLTLRRMSPRAGDVTARVARELPRAMDRMADASDGIAALLPVLSDVVRTLEDRVESALPRD